MLKVLVTGAGGQLGQTIRAMVQERCLEGFVFADRKALDLNDVEAVERYVRELCPDYIVNCAAYTRVDRAEDEPDRADEGNHRAVEHLARAARKTGTVVIHLSTDYVFDGKGCVPYTEEDTPAPRSVYGRTKLAGEKALEESGCRYIIVRTSWLYGVYGGNFLKTMLRLTSERRELKVVSDQVGTPTSAEDLAGAILRIIDQGWREKFGGVYHFSDEGVASWYDFAVEIARLSGHGECRIEPCRTSEFPTRAERPAYSVLDKSKIKRTFPIEITHWRDSLERVIEKIK